MRVSAALFSSIMLRFASIPWHITLAKLLLMISIRPKITGLPHLLLVVKGIITSITSFLKIIEMLLYGTNMIPQNG